MGFISLSLGNGAIHAWGAGRRPEWATLGSVDAAGSGRDGEQRPKPLYLAGYWDYGRPNMGYVLRDS